MKKICSLYSKDTFSEADRVAQAVLSTLLPSIRKANQKAFETFRTYSDSISSKKNSVSDLVCLEFPDHEEPHITIFGKELIPLAKEFGLIHGIYVYRNNPHTHTLIPIISENFGGLDRPDTTDLTLDHYTHCLWVENNENKQHRIQSVSKSIASLILAVAMKKTGKSPSDCHLPLSTLIPESEIDELPISRAQKEKMKENMSKITLKNLLNMSSGLQHDTRIRNIYEEPLLPPWSLDLGNECIFPGKYSYSDFDANLLGKVIECLTGIPTMDFAFENLFGPLGITQPLAKFWNANSAEANPFFACAGGLSLTPNDLAKIGQLVLQNGQWFDEDIPTVDLSEWVQTFKTPHLIFHEEKAKPDGRIRPDASTVLFKGYGHFWWTYEDPRLMLNGKPLDIILFSGIGGQRVFIVPDLDIVVVTTGGFYKVNYATHEKEAAALGAQSRELFVKVIQPYIDFS